MLKKFVIFVLFIFNVNVAFANLTANDMMALCNSKDESLLLGCNLYFAGYLDGMIDGSVNVKWNLPADQVLSVKTVQNSFAKFLSDHPIAGDQPAGTVVTFALLKEGALKEK